MFLGVSGQVSSDESEDKAILVLATTYHSNMQKLLDQVARTAGFGRADLPTGRAALLLSLRTAVDNMVGWMDDDWRYVNNWGTLSCKVDRLLPVTTQAAAYLEGNLFAASSTPPKTAETSVPGEGPSLRSPVDVEELTPNLNAPGDSMVRSAQTQPNGACSVATGPPTGSHPRSSWPLQSQGFI
jgi:hypothetical protein